MLWTDVLMKHNFTTLGSAQFLRDLQAIASVVDRHIPEGSIALNTIMDGARVLSLPLETENGALSLQAACDRFFTDNAEAKRVLEELGIETLTPANARNIVQKRVEYQG
jgi:RAD50-interacting protein 1